MVPLFHNRVRKVCVLVTTLILPALAHAQESSPTAAPQTQIDSLQTTVASLQSQVSSLQTTITTLQSEVTALARIDCSPVRPRAGSLCQRRSKRRNRSNRAKYRL